MMLLSAAFPQQLRFTSELSVSTLAPALELLYHYAPGVTIGTHAAVMSPQTAPQAQQQATQQAKPQATLPPTREQPAAPELLATTAVITPAAVTPTVATAKLSPAAVATAAAKLAALGPIDLSQALGELYFQGHGGYARDAASEQAQWQQLLSKLAPVTPKSVSIDLKASIDPGS